MMRRRVDDKNRNAGHRRRDMRHANKEFAAGLCRLHHFGKETCWRLDMLENLEGANGVIRCGMSEEMLAERLPANSCGFAPISHVGIEPDIIGMRQARHEIAKPAADIEDASSRVDGLG